MTEHCINTNRRKRLRLNGFNNDGKRPFGQGAMP